MKNNRTYLRCKHCGNIVGVINDAGVKMICCGEPMEELQPNTTEAAQEKHVPSVVRQAGQLEVQVGSTMHPMTPEHFIMWIAVAQGALTQRMALTPDSPPAAVFTVGDGPVTVFAYCNLHGLWAAEA